MTQVVLDRAPWERAWYVVARCATCATKRRMLARYAQALGTSVTCLTCGERWTGAYRHERPWASGWRRRSVEDAKLSARELLPRHAWTRRAA